MSKLKLAKLLGLRLRYDYIDEAYVAQEIKYYPSLGAEVEFIFDSEETRWDEVFTFSVSTKDNLDDAWEQAVEKVIGGLQSAIITGIKLN